MHEEPLHIDIELRAVTGASLWLVRATRYLRLPRAECPRPRIADLDGGTADAMWHEHEGVWRQCGPDGTRLRILPAGRPPGARSVLTGVVEHLTGR